jgi:hypothetical protein
LANMKKALRNAFQQFKYYRKYQDWSINKKQ